MNQELINREIKWLIDEKYQGKLGLKASCDIKKLKKGVPLAYLIGYQPFLGCQIDLKYRPLIPRVETEYWTEKAIEDIKKNKKEKIKCLDLFAGSGCIGIAILKNTKNTTVDFVDIKGKYLKQIKRNLELNKISQSRYKIIRSNIFHNIEVGLQYDYILANPPYVSLKEIKMVQKSVLNHEPRKALFAGSDGLKYIKKFLTSAKNYLNPEGKIYMEFGFGQKPAIEKIVKECHYGNYVFFKDQYDVWRYIIVKSEAPA
ncbi:MAG: HemK/PrmC family methyltransferase [Candidatus Paceibacterota bacterium]|jgi:release factor glutamine methyltransferase